MKIFIIDHEYMVPAVSRFQAALIAMMILGMLPSPSAAQGPPAPNWLPSTDRPSVGAQRGTGGEGPWLPSPSGRGAGGEGRVAGPVPVGQPSWRQDFEGATTSWTEAGGDAQYALVAHQRVRGGAHGGQGCEWLQVVGQGGSTVLVAHDIGRPWVIEELRPSIWIYADRPGIQFFAEVTLPRTRDPRTKMPLTTNVYGTAYTTVRRWQQLQIVNLPWMVERQARILRSQLAMNVDDHEAYVSRVLLNIYGGPGVTNVWTDDLEVVGHVASGMEEREKERSPRLPLSSSPPLPLSQPAPREVKLAGSVLKINEYPIFPRSIEYRGEKLAFLKQLGFNTVWLRQAPSPAFLSEARQLGLWLVCPPPELPETDPPPASGYPTIGPEFEPVLVWDLGHGLTGDALEANERRAARVRLADSRFSRPLICAPINNLRSYSRQTNILLIDRRPLGTSMEMPNYGEWVKRQPLLALPGTPVWTTVQTQAGEGLRRQFATLTPGQAPPTVVAPEQIRLLVYTAISSGSRGLLFLSDSSLEAPDGETRQRVMTLQLLNLELEIIEPWVAGGTKDATAECSQRLVTGAILRDDRARIAMPMWLAPGSQCVAPLAAATPLGLTLPDIPESDYIFELTAGRLQPLRHRRQAGGTQVTLDEFGLSTLLFLAQDPAIIEAVTRRAAASGRQIAELERQLAMQKYDTVARVFDRISGRIPPPKNPAQVRSPAQDLETARQNLASCETRLAAGEYAMASAHARRAMMPLRKLERTAWEAAMQGLDSPVAIPGTSSFQALPWFWALVDRTATLRPARTVCRAATSKTSRR